MAVSCGTGKLVNEDGIMGIDMRVSVAGRLEDVVVTAELEAKLAVTSNGLLDDTADTEIGTEALVAFPAATVDTVEPKKLEMVVLDLA